MEILNKRIKVLFFTFVIIFLFLIYRIYEIQFVKGENLSIIANSQYSFERKVSDIDFLILDSRGKDLLQYKNKYVVEIDPNVLKRNNSNIPIDRVIAFNYVLKNYNEGYDITNIITNQPSERIKWYVDEDTYSKLLEIKGINGVYLYIYSSLDKSEAWKIQNLIGNLEFIDDNLQESELLLAKKAVEKNLPTTIYFEKDVKGNIINNKYNYPEGNINLRLTLFKDWQDKIEHILAQDKYVMLKDIGVVIIESDTGNIRALTQNNHKNPNIILGSATADGYVPGSIYKILVEAAALDLKKINTRELFLCEEGKNSLCKEPHGEVTVEEALKVSCNNAFAAIGKRIGWSNMLKYSEKQGLFKKVLGFSGDKEVKGQFRPPAVYEDGPRFLSMGQNMLLSPLQVVSLVNTVVNNGVYVKPNLIEALVDINNRSIKDFPPKNEQVYSKEVAGIVKNHMRKVVEEGTGRNALVEGMDIGGKTGTTERIDYETDKDGKEKIVKNSDGWFVGYFKINNKYYTMAVFIKNINKEGQFGGNTAAPIFKEIIEQLIIN